jgi:hypothetical protein
MRSILFVSMILAVSACGDDGGSTVDAAPIDMGGSADAAGNPPAQGLGAVCNNSMPCPTTPAGLECLAVTANATQGFCALPCGTTAPGAMQPPTGGQAICSGSTPPPGSGTPVCAVTSEDEGTPPMTPWFCAVACGTLQGMDLGTCPGGLTCTMNLCQ